MELYLFQSSFCSSQIDPLLFITWTNRQTTNRFTGRVNGRICFSRLKDRFKTNRKSTIRKTVWGFTCLRGKKDESLKKKTSDYDYADWSGHHLRHPGKKKVKTLITKDQQYAVMSVSGVFLKREMRFPYWLIHSSVWASLHLLAVSHRRDVLHLPVVSSQINHLDPFSFEKEKHIFFSSSSPMFPSPVIFSIAVAVTIGSLSVFPFEQQQTARQERSVSWFIGLDSPPEGRLTAYLECCI